ncbi:FG-GAP repeat protein [Nitrosomonas sp. Nm84]|uniref:beta strand repeat-containing protein n=1 Tax=Nitrosomonas sp. Nm84 TaxID=200124 RepID=UPI000D75FBFA|nr:FG-GAP-like repeat-containing protein [Nitrosomonas sp. Nm84]PXW88244.1 FG-GAP repeat protein [Nitrosomonas sp. Nm84]
MAIPIINVSILNGSNGFRLDGVAASDQSAISISNAGDVNGDGFDDLIVGAWDADPNGNYGAGSSYVVFGKASGFDAEMNLSSLDGSNGFRLDGVARLDRLGWSVSNAGDVNGDGFDDLIVGADGADPNSSASGSSYVVFGKASGFSAAMNLSSLDGSNGFRLDGVAELDRLGWSVSNAGDVNGDGFDDVIVGAINADLNGDQSGSSYVVFGKASDFEAEMDLSSLDGNNGFRLDGVMERDYSGLSVSGAGDINGDGFDDLIVGAPGADSNGNYSAGSSYVVFGKASGFSAAMNLSSLDGNNGFRLDGEADFGSGWSVSTAGDVNGDGFDDVIVGADGADPNGSFSGSSYVVFGKASGFEADMDLSSLDGNNGFRLDGEGAGDYSGGSVSSAGDVNGDGLDDLLVGASGADPNDNYDNHYDVGASYVVFGKVSGFSAVMNLSNLDGSNGFRLDGEANEGHFDQLVSNAGDVNSDGFDDLIVSSISFKGNGVFSGSSYVVFGGNFTGEAVYRGSPRDDHLRGTSTAERFEAGNGNDLITGFGGADVFHGDAGDDIIKVPDLNFQSVDGGIGSDTLELAGGGLNLNLADFDGKIDGIETIDLTGNGNNTLTLTLPGLLSLSDTTDTFTVNGNTDDHVVGLFSGWADGGVDGDYHLYTNQGLALRVDTSVRTDHPARTPAPAGVINLANLDGNNGFRLDGAAVSDVSGVSVSDAGDVNGDGFDDVIIGASGADTNGENSGSSYVVFGKASGFDAVMDLSSLDGNDGFRLDGMATNDRSGESVSAAGDVNGDGFDDVFVGAPSANPNGTSSGSSYVVFGKASGFSAAMNLSSLDGNNGFRLDGVRLFDRSGDSVSSAGDVNGDGFDDVIVGASRTSYVVFGSNSGFDAELNLSNLDGDNGFKLTNYSSVYGGVSVSTAGDINGDGFADLIAGVLLQSNDMFSYAYSSISYVVFGKSSGFNATLSLLSLDGSNGFVIDGLGYTPENSKPSVSSAGDINGDGFDDLIVGLSGKTPVGSGSSSNYVVFGKASGFDALLDLTKLDGNNGFSIKGATIGDRSGFSVSNAGDVNGDGLDDLLIGAYGADPNGESSGSSYVVFGKTTGFGATMNLSSFDSNNGVRLDGAVVGDRSGRSVSSAGDVNGDGFDDLIVGAYGADPNGESSGSSYVIFGSSDFGGDNVIAGTPGNDVLKGTPSADIFEAGDGNDKMIGRGGADVFHGGAGDDYIQVADLGFGSVDGGSGNDTLHLDGKNLNLDLANLGDKIHGIETICLYGRGDNALTLTATNLLDLSDSTNTLRINGNAGDHITIQDDGWVDGGPRGSGYYHVYTHNDAVLLVGQNVTVDFA